MSSRDAVIDQALAHLQRCDPIMDRLIRSAPRFDVRPTRNRFATLARSITSQQISTKAADAIWKRLETRLGSRTVMAECLAMLPAEQIRECGLSGRKASYLTELAQRTLDGSIPLRNLGRLDDDEVIRSLIACKGVGRWTAQMFLIFGLGRFDVLATDDFGLRSAVRSLYRLQALPAKDEFERIAEPWRPYASVASWYCWRSLEAPS